MEAFDKRSRINLCHSAKNCPYEQDKNEDAEIEGMPVIPNDPRTCRAFGHICPHFMEDFGFTRADLKIRAIIHCGETMEHRVMEGKADMNDPKVKAMCERFREVTQKFPISQYPRYYS